MEQTLIPARFPILHRCRLVFQIGLSGCLVALGTPFIHAQGSLTPPGAPAPTMKTLAQIDAKLESRIAVDATNTPGNSGTIFNITQPGSYYLTGNVTGVSGKYGITINASGVTLDLNGFELLGVAGSLTGVTSLAAGRTNVSIVNGSIRNWGAAGILVTVGGVSFRVTGVLASGNQTYGIYLGGSGNLVSHCIATNNGGNAAILVADSSTVSDCSLHSNQGIGIEVGRQCTVANCSVSTCLGGGTGIYTDSGATISNCTSGSNQSAGISAGNGSTLTNCTANSNALNGINVFSDSLLSNCVANGNTGTGINANDGCSLQGCVADNNTGNGITVRFGNTVRACHVRGNPLNGIESSAGGQILDNLCDSNGTAAGTQSNILVTGDSCRVEGNSILSGDRGIATNTGGNVIVRNSVRGGTNAYGGIAAGNDVGPIGSAATATSPWANISY